MNILNIALAFIEGIGLVLSPCILPILPLVLAASFDGGKRRPIGIIIGFILAFAGFGLLSRQILGALHVDPQIIRDAALVLLMVFGIVMLSQKLSDALISATQKLANVGQSLTARWDNTNGFWGGVAVGCLIGLIWTPCAGPVMAAAIVQIIQSHTSLEASLTVIMFALGAGLPMLVIALAGRKVMDRLSFLKTHSHVVRRVLGLIIIGVAVLIYEGADVRLIAATAPTAPQNIAPVVSTGTLQNALDTPYEAPEIAEGQWFNSDPLKISDLRGKVVLIDFWTYSCINCVRTLPYITSWDEKYRGKGLVIIGVHSPEFDFEKKPENVEAALPKNNIHYPVVLDNQLETWKNFNNHYWPAHYLIDKNGQVVYTHFGEGDYDVTENNIRFLLGLDAQKEMAAELPSSNDAYKTPETYLGAARAKNYSGTPDLEIDKTNLFHSSPDLAADNWGLDGNWKIEGQKITNIEPGAHLRLNFTARHVFLVMGTADGKPKTVSLKLNNAPIGEDAGKDVKDGTMTINRNTLYELVDQKMSKNGLLDIEANDPLTEMYAFTFGN